MPHTQGYGYESYTCPDCGSNLFWPGTVCPDCKGKGKADFQTPPNRDGPPIKPLPWQEKSLSWAKQDKEERAQRQLAADAADKKQKALYRCYAKYRLLCKQNKLLALTAPVEDVSEKLHAALDSGYKLVTHEVSKSPRGEIATVIISCEEVCQPVRYRMFDLGWRPAKPPVKDSSLRDNKSDELRQDHSLSEPEQPNQELPLDSHDVAEWEAYTEAEQLKTVHSEPEAQETPSTTNIDPDMTRAVAKSKIEKIIESESSRNPKWNKVGSINKSFWKKLRKNAE